MKVQALLNQLNKLNPEDDVCAMLFTKEMFEAHEYMVSDSDWSELCQSFDNSPMTANVFEELSISIDYEVVEAE